MKNNKMSDKTIIIISIIVVLLAALLLFIIPMLKNRKKENPESLNAVATVCTEDSTIEFASIEEESTAKNEGMYDPRGEITEEERKRDEEMQREMEAGEIGRDQYDAEDVPTCHVTIDNIHEVGNVYNDLTCTGTLPECLEEYLQNFLNDFDTYWNASVVPGTVIENQGLLDFDVVVETMPDRTIHFRYFENFQIYDITCPEIGDLLHESPYGKSDDSSTINSEDSEITIKDNKE